MGDFNKGYRTLTVDKATYDLLEAICKKERRKKKEEFFKVGRLNYRKFSHTHTLHEL